MQIGRQIITQNGSKENIDETGGEILSPETIYHGDEVTFVFKEFEGFRFINWKDSEGNLISVQNTITQVITEHDTLYALVEKNEYQLDLTNNGNGHAKVSENNQPPFEWNDSINIIAVPDDHWEFVRWIGLGIEDVLDPKSASTYINIKKDSNLTAEFKRKDYDLNVNVTPLGYGSVTLSPNKNSYHYGDIVNLVVHPSPNRKLFEKWENEENLSFVNDTGEFDKNISLKIEGNAYISAKLYSQKYTIAKQVLVVDSQDNEKILNKFGGSISGNTTHFDGEDGNYSIILNDGYKLLWWKDLETNETLSTEMSLIYSDFDKNLSLAAFVTDRIYKIDIQLSPSMRGVLRWGNSDIQGNSFSENSKFGEIINFSATPHDNYKFSHWNIIEGDNIAYRVFSDSVTKSVSNDLQIAGYLAPTNDIEIIINLSQKTQLLLLVGMESSITILPTPSLLNRKETMSSRIGNGQMNISSSQILIHQLPPLP